MKHTKWVAALFGLLGVVLFAGSVMLCFCSLEEPAYVLAEDTAAPERTMAWMEAVCSGNYDAAQAMVYGRPELRPGGDQEEPVSTLFCDAFADSLTYEFLGPCYATQFGLSRDVRITALDISAVMGPLRKRTEDVVARRIEEWEYLNNVYDENNNYQNAFVMDALREAAQQLLEEQDFLTSRELTLNLIYGDGQWWIVAEQDLMDVLSGKMD